MITAINEIAKFESVFSKLSTLQFNATLPISIKVLKRVDLNRFTLLMGKKEVETKSMVPLKEGEVYWGEFKTSKEGIVKISNLLQKPSFEVKKEHLSKDLFFSLEEIKEIFSKEKSKSVFKEEILNKMASSKNREDFIHLTNTLLALQNAVFFVPVKIDERRYFFQFKNKQKKDKVKKEFTTSFYVSFENLGPINGVLRVADNDKKLTLYAYYKKSALFLKEELKNLHIRSEIFVSKEIKPLFETNKRLLDIKG